MKYYVWVTVLGVLLIPGTLNAQTERPSCATGFSSTKTTRELPKHLRWQGPFADTNGHNRDHRLGDGDRKHIRPSLAALWQQDPIQVTWSTAHLATDPTRASSDVARLAADWYLRHSGEAEPILSLLETTGDQSFRRIALRAIRPPISPAHARIVFRYACDASWLLAALRADTAYREMVQTGRVHVAWPDHALAELYAAAPLLTGAWRAEVEAMIARGRD